MNQATTKGFMKSIKISLAERVLKRLNEKFKYVLFCDRRNKIFLCEVPYKCLDTNDIWIDFEDGEYKLRVNSKRMRYSKAKKMVYLGLL